MQNEWTIFGERLKAELDRQEMSFRQFAEKAEMTTTTVCRYVNSERVPRANEILKSSKVLGVTCDYLLGLSDDPYETSERHSIEPERKKGENIFMQGKGHCEFKCSLCGVEIGVVEGGDLDGGYFKFCPGCGAELEDE